MSINITKVMTIIVGLSVFAFSLSNVVFAEEEKKIERKNQIQAEYAIKLKDFNDFKSEYENNKGIELKSYEMEMKAKEKEYKNLLANQKKLIINHAKYVPRTVGYKKINTTSSVSSHKSKKAASKKVSRPSTRSSKAS